MLQITYFQHFLDLPRLVFTPCSTELGSTLHRSPGQTALHTAVIDHVVLFVYFSESRVHSHVLHGLGLV